MQFLESLGKLVAS